MRRKGADELEETWPCGDASTASPDLVVCAVTWSRPRFPVPSPTRSGRRLRVGGPIAASRREEVLRRGPRGAKALWAAFVEVGSPG